MEGAELLGIQRPSRRDNGPATLLAGTRANEIGGVAVLALAPEPRDRRVGAPGPLRNNRFSRIVVLVASCDDRLGSAAQSIRRNKHGRRAWVILIIMILEKSKT